MDPPVPIPNTVVKHSEAESTCLETGWEDRKLPVKRRHPAGCFFVAGTAGGRSGHGHGNASLTGERKKSLSKH